MNDSEEKILQQLSENIRKEIGLYFPSNKFQELKFKLAEVAREFGYSNVEQLLKYLRGHKEDPQKVAELLALKLTIGETYFWRDRELFRALEEVILPSLIARKRETRKTLRIWSAGSSSGEEAYSIAILLKRMIADIDQWSIQILATDINTEALAKARRGVYTEWSFRSAPSWLKPNYFHKNSSKEYEINDEIKNMVTYGYLNLAKDPYPSLSNNTNAMDLIFCRNVLMYFAHEDILEITDKMYNCIVEKGLLLTTAIESFQYLSPRYRLVHIHNVSVYERSPKPELVKEQAWAKRLPDKNETELTIPKRNHTRKKKESKKSPYKKRIESPKSDNSYEAVEEFFRNGQYHKAEELLNVMINGTSMNEDKTLMMSRIKANIGKLEEAVKYCERAININKVNPVSYYLLANIEAEKGNLEKAYKTAQKAFFLDSSFVINNFLLGSFAEHLGKDSQALKHYDNARKELKKMGAEEIVPESDGMTAGRLSDIINKTIEEKHKE